MPPLTYIHGFETARTTAGGGMLTVRGGGETMLHRELNIANGEQIMAEFLGHSKDLITLSLSLSLMR